MDDRLKDKLAKVLALVNKGATEGEKKAAEKALQRMIDKYNINPEELGRLTIKRYRFKYTTDMETILLMRLVRFVLENEQACHSARKHTFGVKEVSFDLEYFDYVTLSASYEYFRRHMKAEWNKHCALLVKRCRTTKTRNKKREELQEVFMSKYFISSNLYGQSEVSEIDMSKVSSREREYRSRMAGVQGGKYNRQLNNGLLLEHQNHLEK